MSFYSSKHSFNYINQYNHISESNWNKILKCDWLEAQFKNQYCRIESTNYAFAIEDYTSIVQRFFSLQKTSEILSFYKENDSV